MSNDITLTRDEAMALAVGCAAGNNMVNGLSKDIDVWLEAKSMAWMDSIPDEDFAALVDNSMRKVFGLPLKEVSHE